jgi:ribosome-associated toxin RatA of RatAB toxin-antitoxin module
MKLNSLSTSEKLLVILIGASVCAAEPMAAPAPPRVAMTVSDLGHGIYAVDGDIQVAASRKAVWDVLTDYNHIAQFAPLLLRSTIEEREGNHVIVEQVGRGQILLFARKIHVLLDVREKPYEKLSFVDRSHRDFDFYKGSWEIREGGADLEVTYRLEAKRNFLAPNFLARAAFVRAAENLIEDVRDEIARRELTSAVGSPSYTDPPPNRPQ